MASTIVGLEITAESVRAVEVVAGAGGAVVSAGEVQLPSGAARDSEVLDAEAVAVALRQLWAEASFSSRKVVLGVGSRRILVREFSTPVMAPELLRASLPYQVQDLLPVPPAQAVLDFYPVAESDGHVHGLLVAAVAESVEELLAATTKAKLQVSRVDLVPFGLARALARVSEPAQTSAVVYAGDHTTYVVVATGHVPQFVRVIPIDLPTAAVCARTGLEAPADEGALELVGATPRLRATMRMTSSPLDDSGAIADLVDRVRNTLAFYGSRSGSATVQSVYFAGPGSDVAGAHEALVAGLDRPVRSIDVSELAPPRKDWMCPEPLRHSLVSTIGIVLGEEN